MIRRTSLRLNDNILETTVARGLHNLLELGAGQKEYFFSFLLRAHKLKFGDVDKV